MSEIEACTSKEVADTPIESAAIEDTEKKSLKESSTNLSATKQVVDNKPGSQENQNKLNASISPLVSPTKGKRRSGSRSKHRSGKNRKRKWKPYCKLSWIERKKVEERDARRAQRVRDEMSACGLALAPYNTTQFLMNDHDIKEPDYGLGPNEHSHKDHHHHSGESSDEYSMCSDDEDYINQQFMADYETFHDQYLQSLSQEELVEQYVEMEDKVEALQNKLNEVREERKLRGTEILDPEAELQKILVFREEIRKISLENEELEKRNLELEKALIDSSRESSSSTEQVN